MVNFTLKNFNFTESFSGILWSAWTENLQLKIGRKNAKEGLGQNVVYRFVSDKV